MIKVYYKWIFCTNISPVEIIKKGAFGGTYFRDIYSSVNDKFYKELERVGKNLKNLEILTKILCF